MTKQPQQPPKPKDPDKPNPRLITNIERKDPPPSKPERPVSHEHKKPSKQ